MLSIILLILCGILLVSAYFPANWLKGVASWLNPAGGILGVIALVLGVWGLIQGGFTDLSTWILTLSGVLLGARMLPGLSGMASFLNPVGGIVGIIALVLGIMGLL